MITVQEAVDDILKEDFRALRAMRAGYLNLSAYARQIESVVSALTKKNVKLASVVVSLARFEKRLPKETISPISISQLFVHSPVSQLVYPKITSVITSLTHILDDFKNQDDALFSFSSGTREIAIIISASMESKVMSAFKCQPNIHNKELCAIGIRFDERHVQDPNVGLVLLEKIAAKNIVLNAAMTTYNEFILVLSKNDLHSAIESLKI